MLMDKDGHGAKMTKWLGQVAVQHAHAAVGVVESKLRMRDPSTAYSAGLDKGQSPFS